MLRHTSGKVEAPGNRSSTDSQWGASCYFEESCLPVHLQRWQGILKAWVGRGWWPPSEETTGETDRGQGVITLLLIRYQLFYFFIVSVYNVHIYFGSFFSPFLTAQDCIHLHCKQKINYSFIHSYYHATGTLLLIQCEYITASSNWNNINTVFLWTPSLKQPHRPEKTIAGAAAAAKKKTTCLSIAPVHIMHLQVKSSHHQQPHCGDHLPPAWPHRSAWHTQLSTG